MSLVGLESPAVERAFQAAHAHPEGGWLLLHYIARDELDVLVGGTGGLPAFHDAVAAYQKQSPLYGYLHIRGKKLFFKYCPSGTSRLLQARTTVHSRLVSDRLAPHDATLNCTDPNDISEAQVLPVLGLEHGKEVDDRERLPGKRSQDLLTALSGNPVNKQDGFDLQTTNPEVLSILARLKAARIDSEQPSQARRTSFSGASGHGIIIDPYLSQLPPARSTIRSAGHTSKRSSAELGSQHSRALASPTKSDEIDELEYMYSMLKPKVKHTAKPANIEKVQKTIAAGQIRQKLPAGMRVGRTNSGNKPVRSHGRSNSAIEEWRQRNANPHLSTSSEGTENRQLIDKQKTSMDSRSANEEKNAMNREASSTTPSQRAQGKAAEALATPITLTSRKSYDMLRPDGPSARPSYTSYDNRTMLTPEKQRLMKALAMRRRQLGAASKRTIADTESELLLSAEPDHGMSSIMGARLAEGLEHADSAHAKKSSVSNMAPMISPVDVRDATDKVLPQELGEEREDNTEPPSVSQNDETKEAVREAEDETASDILTDSTHKISDMKDLVVTAPEDTHDEELGIKESSLFSSRHLAVESPAHAKSLSSSKRNSPRGLFQRTSYNVQAEGGDGVFDDGLSPSESLIEELRKATVQEAKQVTATHTTSPKLVAKEASNTIPSPLDFPATITPLSADEVKASPVDSIPTAYPFPRALVTVMEASDPVSSRHATPMRAPQATDSSRAITKEQSKHRPQTRRDNSTSWLSISRTTTEDSVSEDQKHAGTSFTSRESSMPPPSKLFSHNPRGNSRLPEIHPNSRAQFTFTQPRPQQDYDQGRGTTITLDFSPVKRTPSLSLFTRHRDHDAQSTTDLLNDSSSPAMKSPESARSPRSQFGRDSTSPISTVNQQQYMKSDLIHATPTAGRRSSEISHFSRLHSRAPSVVSLEPVDEEARQKHGSWTMRTLKRMSGLGASSRNSPTRLSEQCVTEHEIGSEPLGKIPEMVKNGGNMGAINLPAVVTQLDAHLPIVMGELNCLLPDSLLWKRKWVEVVTGNYLVLSGMSVQERAKTQPNRWHLSSFRPPYAAGTDREELPFSVVFELREGGKVQFACGDGDGQVQVLEYLLDAHRICFAGELLRR